MPKEKTAENTVTMEFVVRKETKGTVVFEETTPEERPHIFYMLKGLHEQLGSPNQIVMTIETN